MTGYVLPRAGWQVTLDGRDLTEVMNPRLLSLRISEKRAESADQLDIELNDSDGLLEIPPEGATLRISLGWARGSDLPIGLIDKGSFKVDEATFDGPPDRITIRARSADFTDAFRVRRERSFVGKTVQQVLETIASANGLTARIDAAMGRETIPALGSGPKSDAALLAALGKRFDAVATVKAGALIFAPIGSGKTASGKALPTIAIDRKETGPVRYARVSRQKYAGVEASWHDRDTGKRHTVRQGGSNDSGTSKPKRLRKLYANEADAKQAAEAEASRIGRRVATATIRLAYGRPDIFPNIPIKLTGFKSEINERAWLVEAVRHEMDGRGGLTTELSLEAARVGR